MLDRRQQTWRWLSRRTFNLRFRRYVYRAEKERAKFQQEVYELLSQIEIINKEKVSTDMDFFSPSPTGYLAYTCILMLNVKLLSNFHAVEHGEAC